MTRVYFRLWKKRTNFILGLVSTHTNYRWTTSEGILSVAQLEQILSPNAFLLHLLSRKLLQQGRAIYFDEKYFKLFLAIAPNNFFLDCCIEWLPTVIIAIYPLSLPAISTFLSSQHHHGFLPKIRLLLGAKKGDKNNCLKTAPHHFYILA